MVNNAWDILGVPPGSDLADILRAFRRLSIRYHPDKQLHKTQNEQAESARQYLLISQSRDILTHPTMRALHDDLIARQEAGGWSDHRIGAPRSVVRLGRPVGHRCYWGRPPWDEPDDIPGPDFLVDQEVGAPATGREAIITASPGSGGTNAGYSGPTAGSPPDPGPGGPSPGAYGPGPSSSADDSWSPLEASLEDPALAVPLQD